MSRSEAPVPAYIGLGSNLDHPVQQLVAAQMALARLPDTILTVCSSLYRSAPLGPAEQPDYINAVAAIRTWLPPDALLRALQEIEQCQGRIREGERWGPRTLDLDILLYGQERITTAELTVPHPGMVAREFVLYPLFEIAPQITIPGQGPLHDCLAHCPRRGLQRLEHTGESRAS